MPDEPGRAPPPSGGVPAPPSGGAAPVPARPMLDRAALERVLARAAELQANGTEPLGEMTEEQLVDLGREVGLDPRLIRQAILEERSRITVAEDASFAGRLAGPTWASASRVVAGTPAQLLAAVDRWMQREENLQVKRRVADRMSWEPRRDIVGTIKRGFRVGGRGYYLSHATEVAATVMGAEGGRTLVRLDADLSGSRRARMRGGVATAGGGLAAGAGIVTIGTVLSVFPPVAIAVGVGVVAIGGVRGVQVARHHREVVARAQLALEQVLDQLEHGPAGPGSVLATLIDAATRPPRPIR